VSFLPVAGLITGAELDGKRGGAFFQALPALDLLSMIAAALPVAHGLDEFWGKEIRIHDSSIHLSNILATASPPEHCLNFGTYRCQNVFRCISDVFKRHGFRGFGERS
jgi:hypothetical protein